MKETRVKKSLLALAVLAAAGCASAQSSVTLFGVVDASLTWGRGSIADRLQVTNSAYTPSRLGFRGTEDLGSGMSASFWLEMGFNNDDGTGLLTNTNNQASGQPAPGSVPAGAQGLTFGRRATVSLASGWGEVRAGRDYTPQFWNRALFDPLGLNGVGTSIIHNLSITGVTAVRASNSIGYFLPAGLGGMYGQAMYYVGENASNTGATRRDGTGAGIRVGYAAGPFNVAVSTGYTRYAAGGVHQSNISGHWDFRVAKLMAQYEHDSNAGTEARGWLIGGLLPVGVGEVRLAYSRATIDPAGAGAQPRSSKVALGYVHHLSKRTALYTTYARVRNSNGATFALAGSATAANNSSSGLDLGLRHSF